MGVREKPMWNFHGSWFSTLEFPSDLTQFSRTSMGESLFSPEFLMVKVKKVYPQPLVFGLLWNNPILWG